MNIKESESEYLENRWQELEKSLGLRKPYRPLINNNEYEDAAHLLRALLFERANIIQRLAKETADFRWIQKEILKAVADAGGDPDYKSAKGIDEALKYFLSILEGWYHECKDLAKSGVSCG